MPTKKLSVVIPVYGCVECLDELIDQIDSVTKELPLTVEILLVDDRSPDDAWQKINSLSSQNRSIRGIRLSRNFGQHAAITAGIEQSSGDYIAVMDCDLQDPPQLLGAMLSVMNEGEKLVLARRTSRDHNRFRSLLARYYFFILSKLSGRSIDGRYGSLSMMSRQVAEEFLKFREHDRHYVMILTWLGFDPRVIEYDHAPRHAGRSSYSLRRLLQHSMSGIFFQTTRLLTIIICTGIAISLVGFLLAAWVIFRVAFADTPPGWASLMVGFLVSTGVVLFSLGTIGIYLEKVFEEVKSRPLYVIEEVTN